MLLAFLSTIISSFSNVFWKKSLKYKIWNRAHEISSYPIPLLLLGYFLFTSFSFSEISLQLVIFVLLIVIIDVIKLPVEQSIYKEEKISVIMPYLNISKVLVIISSFFLFKDVSYTSLWITIFTILVIALWSIDLKTRKLPRNFSKLLFVESLRTIGILLGWYVVITYWEIWYFNSYVLLAFISAFILLFVSKQVSDFINVWIPYWAHRTMWSIWWLSWFLSLIVINNLGLSISILLGFIWVGITLIFSFLFLKDIPSKKDIFLTILVMCLVWIWYYFK